MTKPYEPQPGTLTHRIVEHLKKHPGKKFAVRVLADQMEQPRDYILPSLESAIKHGVVRKEKIDGLIKLSLGNGTPTDSLDPDDGPISKQITPETRWGDAPAAKAPEPVVEVKPKGQQQKKPASVKAPTEQPQPEPFAYGYHSSGVLSVSKDGQTVEMTPDEAGKIAHFIFTILLFNRHWQDEENE